MKIDPLKQYAQLREKLTAEKAELEARLQQIKAVLTPKAMAPIAEPTVQLEPSPSKGQRRGRGQNALSMREMITKALTERGPLARKELGQAVLDLGYKSKAKNPLGSMGIVLYGKNPPFKKKDGKFCLPDGIQSEAGSTGSNGNVPAKKKRTMSPEAKEKIAAAQRARWAKFRKG